MSVTLSLKDKIQSTTLTLIKKNVDNEYTDVENVNTEGRNTCTNEQAHQFEANVLAGNSGTSEYKGLSFPK